MKREVAAAYASHETTRDLRLMTCGCGQQYETRADEPAAMCRNCRNEVEWRIIKARKVAKLESKLYNQRKWVLVYDSSAYPMRAGYKLCADEVEAGLRLGTFALGTRLALRGREYVVTEAGLEER